MIGLSREDRLFKANEILNDNDIKQAICNQILGCSFKEVERVMLSIINERQITEAQKEQLELQESAPQKFDYDFDLKATYSSSFEHSSIKYGFFSKEETLKLLKESDTSLADKKEVTIIREYPIYSLEDVQLLLKQEEDKWDKANMTELETKTKRKMKRIKHTKPLKK